MNPTAGAVTVQTTGRLQKWKNIVFYAVVLRYGYRFLWALYDKGVVRLTQDFKRELLRLFFTWFKRIPFIKKKIDKEIGNNLNNIRRSFLQEGKKKEHSEEDEDASLPQFVQLPESGISSDEILELLARLQHMGHHDYRQGKLSGAVYHGGKDITDLSTKAYEMFVWSNPLHPDVFPGVRKMESEIVSMVLKMFHGDENACGTTTSGGTESILLACKAYRDWGRAVKGITKPEIVVATSVHCAFDKACSYFGIRLVHVPIHPVTCRADVPAMKRAITSNTVALVASAPGFPHGVIDDVASLARVAVEKQIGLHVDCCLGGFVLPFMDKAGFPLAPFDFRVKGVTSISCDTHKYGCAPKGSSVILYSSKELRAHQYFVACDWQGGIYASPTIAGSRPGALIAACWATMMQIGEEGYVQQTREIVSAARRIAEGIRGIDGVRLMGTPDSIVVAWTSDAFDIYKMAELLTEKGWNLNSLQYPASMHICVTYANKDSADAFLADLAQVAAALKRTPGKKADGAGAIYGLAQTIPDRSLVDQMARGYIDILYENYN